MQLFRVDDPISNNIIKGKEEYRIYVSLALV